MGDDAPGHIGENAPSTKLLPLTAALLECITPGEVVLTVVERAVTLLGARAGLVALVSDDGESLEVIGTSGYADVTLQGWERFPLAARLPLSDAVRENRILWFESGADWKAQYPEMMARVKEGYFQAAASLPLTARGRVFGGLHFSFPFERPFSAAGQEILHDIARQCALALDRALLLQGVERARDESQHANSRLTFLARASALLAESLDYETRLDELVRLCVPDLADWAGVDVLADDGNIVRLAVAHRIQEREAVMRESQLRYPPDADQGQNPLTVIRTGRRLFFPEITEEMIDRGAVDAGHARLLKTIGISAALCLPIMAHGRILGALSLGMGPEPSGSGRTFTPEAVSLAEELAHRAAVSVDNARLYAESLRAIQIAKQSEAERERLVLELKRMNERQRDWLRESEQRFRLLVEGVQDYAIFMLDPQGFITTWNAGAERFKGYKAHEIIGQHFSRFYTEEDVARRHPWHELEIAASEGRYEEEGWRIRKDGTRFWANVVITALRNAQGTLIGFGKVTRDMTERRLREQERASTESMQQQRRFLKDVLASVTQGRLILCDIRDDLPATLTRQPVGAPIPLSPKMLKSVRALVGEAAVECRLPKERIQDLVTAVSECAMNAVQHAGGGTATVYEDVTAGKIQAWIQDEGKGIDLSRLPRATLEAGFSTGGVGIGHGFSLMIACCRRVYLLTGTEGTTVVLEQERLPPEPSWLESFMG